MNRLLTTIYFFISLLIGGCLEDSKLKIDLNMEPAALNDGWEISTPVDEGFDESALREAYNLFFSENDYVTGISLLVARNGKLVTEGYCRRDMKDRDVKRNIQSATKSFTSLVFGIAWDMEYFDNLDQKLYDIIPEDFDANLKKRDITLRHLLTMKSGLEFNNNDFAEELHVDSRKNQMKYILAKSLYADPGTEYWYRDCDPQLLGGAILKQTSMRLDAIADENLIGPMGITDYYWEKNADGHNWAAQALYMRPRDMVKIGILILNEGTWKAQQLVSEEWIEQSTSIQTEFPAPDYGFYWWIYEPDYPRLPEVRAITAEGSGGQMLLIVPEKELIIVMTSEPYTDGQTSLEWEFFFLAEMIINSIVE
jgi:CubicO group peptidase (beta-lactamase class C family)